jgi:hypothetical protein
VIQPEIVSALVLAQGPALLGGWLTATNAPSYLTAVIASVAAYFAYRSSKASRASASVAQAQLTRLENDRAREHAENLSVWVESIKPETYLGSATDGSPHLMTYDKHVYRIVFAIQNASKRTIYQVMIYAEAAGQRYLVGEIAHVRPNQTTHRLYMTTFLREETRESQGIPYLGFFYFDGHDYWHRVPNGTLLQLSHALNFNFECDAVRKSTTRLRVKAKMHDTTRKDLFVLKNPKEVESGT